MSHAAVAWALKQKLADAGTKLVLIELANLANAVTHECYPGATYLAERTQQDVAKVRADLEALHKGALIADRGTPPGRRRGTLWRLAVAGPVEDWRDPF